PDMSNYVVLSDIQGLEDHTGDMDFKVAGTKEGVTAIQMDIELKGINVDLLRQALERGKAGRMHIMNEMLKCIDQPRQSLSEYAPKVEQISIPSDRIGEVIGPGGKIIKEIINLSGAQVDIEEDEDQDIGIVNISSDSAEAIRKAKTMVENIMKVVEIGEQYEGTVTRIENYGAFVEYLPGREGLVHVSNMSTDYVKDPRSLLSIGDDVQVRIAEIKDDGKIGLSMLSEQEEAEAKRKKRESHGGNNRGRSNDRRGSRGSRGSRDNNRSNSRGRSNNRSSSRSNDR
ncbi:MAG: S1 RNA-binding domain-containing protein, partial [Candidatus Pacebacteria bacterium]|nr:S1 RNA-binding domain-containing protein [Candidatus Paceibacterota bacterium]